ncbi:ribonuclease E inhibitor RraB [Flavobacterium johnsoniae]|uniref:ribonuclease E inhibitor RraB n=1 Tax=Flavobacterium johnsoniae TaxID=986 RepID=UPI0025B16F5B|nr:ribonuclease E inhibitor RraB [Flavobacterium johnsoniae]WJS95971.1 ribonuclease E inhibitor RraB [Flavobacterium johnsoniae]
MKQHFILLLGLSLSFFSCQTKALNDFEIMKQKEIEANKKTIKALHNEGDKLIVPREVFHWIYFSKISERENYLKEVVFKGFKLVSMNKIDDEIPYQLQIKRIDKVDEKSVNEYAIYLWEKANEYNGEYDGWETSVEK